MLSVTASKILIFYASGASVALAAVLGHLLRQDGAGFDCGAAPLLLDPSLLPVPPALVVGQEALQRASVFARAFGVTSFHLVPLSLRLGALLEPDSGYPTRPFLVKLSYC